MITVANKTNYKNGGFYIGRPSILGNPFSYLPNSLAQFKVSSREEAVEKYRPYFYDQLASNKAFIDTIDQLVYTYKTTGELILVCWCSPLACHGDIIKEYIESII